LLYFNIKFLCDYKGHYRTKYHICIVLYDIHDLHRVSFITVMSTAVDTDVLADAAFCVIQLLYLWH